MTIERAGSACRPRWAAKSWRRTASRTGPDGAVGILRDDTLLSAGPNSSLAVDRFVFDSTTHAGQATTSLRRGTLAVVTGKLAKGARIGAIPHPDQRPGVRGTEFAVEVAAGRRTDMGRFIVVLRRPARGLRQRSASFSCPPPTDGWAPLWCVRRRRSRCWPHLRRCRAPGGKLQPLPVFGGRGRSFRRGPGCPAAAGGALRRLFRRRRRHPDPGTLAEFDRIRRRSSPGRPPKSWSPGILTGWGIEPTTPCRSGGRKACVRPGGRRTAGAGDQRGRPGRARAGGGDGRQKVAEGRNQRVEISVRCRCGSRAGRRVHPSGPGRSGRRPAGGRASKLRTSSRWPWPGPPVSAGPSARSARSRSPPCRAGVRVRSPCR